MKNMSKPENMASVGSDALLDGWLPMTDAPKDGTPIIGLYDEGEEAEIVWSDRPVCMLGYVNGGYPAGWATNGDGVDSNLPMDTPKAWRAA